MAQWFKIYHELLRDKKLRLMAAELQMPPALVRGLWVDLLCFAQELDQGGYLRLDDEIPLTWELVCEELGHDDEEAMRFLEAAAKYNLVTAHDGSLYITSWEDRQQKPSDSPEAVRERMRKYRATDAGKLRMWFDNNRGKLTDAVIARDGDHCAHCGTTEGLTVDHILALTNGGTNDVENLQLLCVPCHKRKTAQVDAPLRAQMKRVSSSQMKRDREEERREEKNTRTRVRVPVENSHASASTCPHDGAELQRNIDRGPGLYCTICGYSLEA